MVKEEKRFAAPVVVILVVCVLSLPVLYVLSIGPACWLAVNGYTRTVAHNAVFGPLVDLAETFEPLSDFIYWYVELFV